MTTPDVDPRSFTVTRIISRSSPNDKTTMGWIALSPDGNYVAIGYHSGIIEVSAISLTYHVKCANIIFQIYDTIRYQLYRRIPTGSTKVTALAWHPYFPRTLVAGVKNGNVHLMKFVGDPVRIYGSSLVFLPEVKILSSARAMISAND